MLKPIINFKKNKTVFICQISDTYLKVLKCSSSDSPKGQFSAIDREAIPPDIDEKGLSIKLSGILKKLEFNNNPAIISLPRSLAACRYLKIPTQTPEEIERIVSLQAARYLPYPADELVTAYQNLSVDKDKYSHINLVIVHKDIIDRYLRLSKELKARKINIFLSSYGLCSLYNYLRPQETGATMLIDIDAANVEVAMLLERKVIFSRNFKLNKAAADWQSFFIDELNKSRDAYLRETASKPVDKIVLVGASKPYQGFEEILNKQFGLSVETVTYETKINISKEAKDALLNSEASFASLIGLGLGNISDSLNLLPQAAKEKIKGIALQSRRLRIILFIGLTGLLWFLAIAKNLDNKSRYLARLKMELGKVQKEARPLEEIERRFEVLEAKNSKKTAVLDMLYELHKILPEEIFLTNISYEEENQIVLRGQTEELESVFTFVRRIENSQAFKGFNMKVRFATKKKIQGGSEIVDFEIAGTGK